MNWIMQLLPETPTLNPEIQQMLVRQLRQLGIAAGDTLLVHSALHTVGPIPNKAMEVIAALTTVLGEDGTLLMPGFQQGSEYVLASQGVALDLRTSPSELGYLTEYFRKLPGVLRSVSPTHSISGAGAQARTILSGHERCLVTAGWGSPFEKLIAVHGKILLLGTGQCCNTTMHFLENTGGAPTVSTNRFPCRVTDQQGKLHAMTICPHMPGLNRNYERMKSLLQAAGALHSGQIGQAESQCFSASVMRDLAYAQLQKNPCAFLNVFTPSSTESGNGPAGK